jgi:hypothetical protein
MKYKSVSTFTLDVSLVWSDQTGWSVQQQTRLVSRANRYVLREVIIGQYQVALIYSNLLVSLVGKRECHWYFVPYMHVNPEVSRCSDQHQSALVFNLLGSDLTRLGKQTKPIKICDPNTF